MKRRHTDPVRRNSYNDGHKDPSRIRHARTKARHKSLREAKERVKP